MEVLSLKDKLLKSRTLWSSMNQANFLIDLYETLDNPIHEDIITWSTDGKVLLIKDLSSIAEGVLPYFESCHTTKQFLTRIENCKFKRVSGKEYGTRYAYKHKHFNRDSRPIFECFDATPKMEEQHESELCKYDIVHELAKQKKLKQTSDNNVHESEKRNDEVSKIQKHGLNKYIDYRHFMINLHSAVQEVMLQDVLANVFKYNEN